jgi:hypothetical protein
VIEGAGYEKTQRHPKTMLASGSPHIGASCPSPMSDYPSPLRPLPQVIWTHSTIPKPKGILWHRLSPEKLGQIRVLRDLKQRIERETGKDLPSGPSEKLPPLARRDGRGGRQGA